MKESSDHFNDIVLYTTPDGRVSLEVNVENETVWLSQAHMEILFNKSKKTISEHIGNIFKEGELVKAAVVRKSRTTAADGKTYHVNHYNLDVIISVGYRVKSQRGTQFRIWATQVLRQYLVQGYILNQQQLSQQVKNMEDLQKAVRLVAEIAKRQELSPAETHGILSVLDRYSYALTILDEYDHETLRISDTSTSKQTGIQYEEAKMQIDLWREKKKLSSLFGNEKDGSFKSSLATIYQTFDGRELYPSIEEKAAHLLYFVVKNHSFSDGNKRIAAALFAWFLDRNDYLYLPNGQKRLADNALVALTLMIAQSNPAEKNIIVKVVINLINLKN